MRKLFFNTVFFISIVMMGQSGSLELPAIFSDNMVFQRNTRVSVWGKASPEAEVSAAASWGEKAETRAEANGAWRLKLQTPDAGGPFAVKIFSGEESVEYANVLVGEVWICSGQSNMEMPLEGWMPDAPVENSAEVIRNAANSKIRFFTVAREISAAPKDNCTGAWIESAPASAAKFSATAYFFGKKLFDNLQIPIGLIHSSWGGTQVEAWTSGKFLSTVDEYKDVIKKIEKSKGEMRELNNWLENHETLDLSGIEGDDKWRNLNFNDAECADPNFDDSKWQKMNLPMNWEYSALGNFDGAVWFRRSVEIPAEWAGKNLTLELGAIDDMDAAYVNGVKVGATEAPGFWQQKRVYRVPASLVGFTKLSLAVRVIDNQGGGGIYGRQEDMKIYNADSSSGISLAGEWKYLAVAEYRGLKFYVFGSDGESENRPKVSIELSETGFPADQRLSNRLSLG